MANDYKCVSYFSSGSSSWTEVMYCNASNISGAGSNFSTAVVNARLKLANPLTYWRKVRISQVGAPRVSTILPINKQGTDTTLGYSTGTNPMPNTEAIVCTLGNVVPGASRRLWLRGSSQAAAARSPITGNDSLDPNFSSALTNWFLKLQQNNFEILPLVPVGQQGVQYVNVTNVAPGAAPGQTIVTCATPPGLSVGNQVLMSLFSKKDLPALNGSFTVTAIAGNTITIAYALPNNVAQPVTKGRLKKQIFASGAGIAQTYCSFSFIGGRKTKTNFTGSRGARSASRIRLQS